jgi:CMP-N,N'-diacetyllegionaminic acid synthase
MRRGRADVGAVLALVPARAGSKGIPGKNLRPLGGRSLIDYAARVARDSEVVDRAVLSTDSEEIAAEGRRAGLDVPFLRPAALARDDTPMKPVIEHALVSLAGEGFGPEIVLLLQPTSPLRTPDHLRDAVRLLRASNADSVVTVVELPRHLSPDYVMKIDDGELKPFLAEGAHVTRRQDARPAYVRDGTVYAFWARTLLEQGTIYGRRCVPLLVDPADSITIDSPGDWQEAERILRRRGSNALS